jgi:RHS repeat-associated protein
MAEYYREHGRYSLALAHWEKAWVATKGSKEAVGQKIAVRSIAGWTRLLGSIGHKETMAALFKELDELQLPLGSYGTFIEGTHDGLIMMNAKTGSAYRCGSYALANVAAALQMDGTLVKKLSQVDSPDGGFHVSELLPLAETNGFAVQAVWRPAGEKIVVPSVVHWKLNHYAAIVAERDGRYKVMDPTFRSHVWMDMETIDAEASGVFLVPTGKVPAHWLKLNSEECARTYGKGGPNEFDDDDDEGPSDCDDDDDPPASNDGPAGGDGDDDGDDCANSTPPSDSGMPQWIVSEPYATLWLKDTPLFYRQANGKWANLQLRYKHRGEDKGNNVGSFGPKWECNLVGFLQSSTATPDAYVNHAAGGGFRSYQTDGTADYKSQRKFSQGLTVGTVSGGSGSASVASGYAPVLSSPSGASTHYEFNVLNGIGKTNFFLTHRRDRYGRIRFLNYESIGSMVRLTNVVDLDGKTMTMAYTNTTFTNQITSVTDPYGRSAYFKYDATGLLTNITDMAGMTTSFQYDGSQRLTKMITPYGTNSFEYLTGTTANSYGTGYYNTLRRALRVTEPTGDKQLFAYCDFGPESWRHSYHWNRAQYAAISSTGKANVLDMPDADYERGGSKYWLHGTGNTNGFTVSDTVYSVSKPKNISGSRVTSYIGHVGSDGLSIGTQKRVSQINPAGVGTGVAIQRNDLGRPTQITRTSAGLYATYINNFDTAGRILQTVYGPRGERLRAYGYSSTNAFLLTSVTNALGEVIRYTHQAGTLKVTSITLPSGLVRSNVLFSTGGNAGFVSASMEVGFRTNYFNYQNGNRSAQTNELGLATTYLYDNLNRLISTVFPDSTTISNVYDKLDLVAVKDRLNHWTYYGYNSVRQLVAETNAAGQVTTYDYCSCGSPSTITRYNGSTPLVTQYAYDISGNLTNVIYPDGYQLNYTYNGFDQADTVTDSSGVQLHLDYHLLSTKFVVSAASIGGSYLFAKTFDEYGRVAGITDRNGVTVTNGYDALGRVTNRVTIDLYGQQRGSNVFVYTAKGLTNSTDELGHKTWFVYDAAGRLLSQTNANNEVLQFTYNPADQMLTLLDGKNQQTSWNYDEFGRVTNKLDAVREIFRYKYDQDDRLTNRWTAQKGDTFYRHDVIGNLTNVDYPGTVMDIALKYDGLNRLTNVVDAIGTTKFAYTDGGQLTSEDGPWADDTVSYSYSARRRAGLSLAQPNASAWTQGSGYDAYNRLSNVVSAAGNFLYTYWNSGLSDRVMSLGLGGPGYIQNDYDELGRLTSTALHKDFSTILNQHTYAMNEANQRTKQTFTDGNSIGNTHYTDYTYDDIGQLRTAKGKDHAYNYNTGLYVDTSRLNEQFGYAYDAAWNLNRRTNNALVQTFGVNNLNELTNATRSGTLTVAGQATGPRGGDSYWGYPLGVTNVVVSGTGLTTGNADLYTDGSWAKASATLADGNNTYSATAKDTYNRTASDNLTVNLPATNTFSYDYNGNLTNDGRRVFEYDYENQLTNVYVASAWRSEFKYDGFGRRRTRKEYTWSSGIGNWLLTNEVRYVYDGMLVIQERDGNNTPQVSYTRGNDLSGSPQGAGGIGGLLARTYMPSTLDPRLSTTAHAYYHADGNGNITALVNTNGIVVARYNYDPYGNLLGMSGPLAEANAYRFSSKEWLANAALYYYGFRCYEPNTQRWLNRDPIEEEGGINFYAFLENNPANEYDALGLLPPSNPTCAKLKQKIENLEKEVAKRARELYLDPQGLPGKVAGDDKKPSLSRSGHQRLLNEAKRNLAAKKALYQALCSDPEPPKHPKKTLEDYVDLADAISQAILVREGGSILVRTPFPRLPGIPATPPPIPATP